MTVHTLLVLFIDIIMESIKSDIQQVSKVVYFSDGAAAQYKNCTNLKNLCLHKQDFGIEVEWNCFATSHGKSPVMVLAERLYV